MIILIKNVSYSLVGAGKDKTGFHGTTIQTVVPKPSRVDGDPTEISVVDEKTTVCNSKINSRERKLDIRLIDNLVNPVDNVGPPPNSNRSRFSNLSFSDLKETDLELAEWSNFINNMTNYGFTKSSFQDQNIVLPGLKKFFLFQRNQQKNLNLLLWPFLMKLLTVKILF